MKMSTRGWSDAAAGDRAGVLGAAAFFRGLGVTAATAFAFAPLPLISVRALGRRLILVPAGATMATDGEARRRREQNVEPGGSPKHTAGSLFKFKLV